MHIEETTAPVGDVISLQEAKEHLVVTHTADDDLIIAIVAAVTSSLDGINGITGRALRKQSNKLYADAWPTEFVLPLPPMITVDLIDYVDDAGATQTLASSEYQATKRHGRDIIIPAYDKTWPLVRAVRDTISVTFTSGYVAQSVPPAIVHAAKLMVGHFYEHREAVVITRDVAQELPMAVEHLLRPWRVGFVE